MNFMNFMNFFKTLSGRLLLLTVLFVLLAEILIYIPSIARFRLDYLKMKLDQTWIVSAALVEQNRSTELQEERERQINDFQQMLLNYGGVTSTFIRTPDASILLPNSPPLNSESVRKTYDLREPVIYQLIWDAVYVILNPNLEAIRIVGDLPGEISLDETGRLITTSLDRTRQPNSRESTENEARFEVTLNSRDLRRSMIEYSLNILGLSIVISVVTASLVLLSIRLLIIWPIDRLVHNIKGFANSPGDRQNIIRLSATSIELREAENALKSMQEKLSDALLRNQRLANIGKTIAQTSHDIRGTIANAQSDFELASISTSEKSVEEYLSNLEISIDQINKLSNDIDEYAKAGELKFDDFNLADFISKTVTLHQNPNSYFKINYTQSIPKNITIKADKGKLGRVLDNLINNSKRSIKKREQPGEITISAKRDEESVKIHIGDNGPGLSKRQQDELRMFLKRDGTDNWHSMGMQIVKEFVHKHGGEIELIKSDAENTEFQISLPSLGDVSA